jgi:hypothetical protein
MSDQHNVLKFPSSGMQCFVSPSLLEHVTLASDGMIQLDLDVLDSKKENDTTVQPPKPASASIKCEDKKCTNPVIKLKRCEPSSASRARAPFGSK